MKKTSLLALSLLAFVPVQAAWAQENIEIEIEDAEPEENPLAFGISEDVDPVIRNEVLNLRSGGLMSVQSEIGTDLLIIDRFQRRARAIEQLIDALGTDGLRQFDPDLYTSLERSPIFIRQQIAEINLERELEEARANLSDLASQISPATPPESFNIFDFPPFASGEMPPIPEVTPPPLTMADLFPEDEEIEEEIAALSEPVEPVIEDFPISLREILGANGVFRAVILHGSELIRVEVGDRLPNDTEIISINEDRINIRRRDNFFDLHIRG